jgi:hypothetical protein
MKNTAVFLFFCVLLGVAVLTGSKAPATVRPAPSPTANDEPASEQPVTAERDRGVPHIGSVQVLNACGMHNAAIDVAEYLRGKGFDVKSTDNAPSWNYLHTIVVARTLDRKNAQRTARALHTDRAIPLRTGEDIYDVVVFVGADYREHIR